MPLCYARFDGRNLAARPGRPHEEPQHLLRRDRATGGPDAIKHLDALMEIPELDAVQWTSGAVKPDGGWDGWYPIYDKVRKADKSLWIAIYDGGIEDWTARADRLVARYGADSLYLLFPTMSKREAERLIDHAERDWK